MALPDSVKELIGAGALGHLVTNNPSGSPQIPADGRPPPGMRMRIAAVGSGLGLSEAPRSVGWNSFRARA
jgi:hypothetical protein